MFFSFQLFRKKVAASELNVLCISLAWEEIKRQQTKIKGRRVFRQEKKEEKCIYWNASCVFLMGSKFLDASDEFLVWGWFQFLAECSEISKLGTFPTKEPWKSLISFLIQSALESDCSPPLGSMTS